MDNQSAVQVLGIVEIGRDGVSHLENCIYNGEIGPNDMAVLDTMAELLEALEHGTSHIPIPNRVKEINANLLFYIDELKQHLVDENVETFLYDFRFHFCSLYRILELEVAYIVEKFVNKRDYPRLYPEVGSVDHNEIIAIGEQARCKVSVVLLAYNNLDYTRDCVQSILDHTNDVEFELILVDNGSTDGTKAYFDSVPGAKVIHLKYNIHLVKGFNIGLMAAEGKYCAAVCNDFIFTPNWLSNLMVCIESDSQIGFVSPGATSISNMQKISIPFTSKEDFIEKARAYNVSNPTKWEERVVLLPNVLCCPTALLDRIGYYDTRFFRGEFLDDDISFKIRRAGYKLIYCGDTVTHHYGSLTTASDHLTNSLEEGRKTFLDKYGLDAWIDAHINPAYIKIDYSRLSGVKSILGIDVKCGADLMQIKNRLWSDFGTKAELSICMTEAKYETDTRSISKNVFLLNRVDKLPEELAGKVDLVYIEKPLDYYVEGLDAIFAGLAQVMSPNGKLIFTVNNSVYIESLFEMLQSSYTMHNRKIYIRELICLHAKMQGFEPYGILNFQSDFSSISEQTVVQLTKLLASGKESQSKQLELLMSKYAVYQMDFQALRQ
ncbi:glycosyltransferase family 2 protein [Paenibacillus sp. MMS18-CY102]|uniref:glycosyltransferase family 2 protein n=1 Tax=Paenibacillus sp. MMS18-CY102 TaxID=2682849 RepID=UPI001366328C|nr:glycosyltransferase [Paenibacillus sp. MMS18-CY102]MWC30906.1 glycosyltransferase [Paenibacillus sp. MMS18-CY102]